MRIDIHLKDDIENSFVNGNGMLENVITDPEQRLFRLEDQDIRQSLFRRNNRWPTDVFVRSNTPWGDLYRTYNWRQVHRMTVVKNAEVLSFDTVPEIVSQTELVNNSSVVGTFSTDMSTSVQNTTSFGWNVQHGLTVGQSISYGITISGTTSIEYNHGWGNNGEVSETVTLSTGSSVNVELAPGQAIVAYLVANRGRARVRVTYMSFLNGFVTANYNPVFNGHHFWRYGVENIINTNGIITTETIDIGMFSSARVEIRDKETTSLLRTIMLDDGFA